MSFGTNCVAAGLAALTGIVRILTLGRASSEVCLDVVLVVSFLAVPLVLVALAIGVELVVHDGDRTPRWSSGPELAVVLMAIAVTHPLSLIITMTVLAPLVLGVASVSGHVRPRNLWHLLPAVGWFVGLAASWWVPMVDRRNLRGRTGHRRDRKSGTAGFQGSSRLTPTVGGGGHPRCANASR